MTQNPVRMTIPDAMNAFLLDQRSRGNSNETIKYYQSVFNKFNLWAMSCGVTYVDDLTVQFCRLYVSELLESSLHSVSVQSYVRGLRVFLRWCYDEEYIVLDISSRVRLPRARRDVIDVLNDSEISSVFGAVMNGSHSERNYIIVSLMLCCGLRLSEVLSLRHRDFHFDEKYIIVNGKGNKQRFVPLPSFLSDFVHSFVTSGSSSSPDSHLVEVSPGRPLTKNGLKQVFRRLKKDSGVDRLHPHLLRHTFATRYLENGGDINTLKEILGHTSLNMTLRYLHIAKTRIISGSECSNALDDFIKIPGNIMFPG